MPSVSRIYIKIKGDGGYWYQTVRDWILYIKDLLEEEYSIEVSLIEDKSRDDMPEVYINDKFVFKGVPGEEGYLIELLKKELDNMFSRGVRKDQLGHQ
ncbi:MAG: hypothetical protein DRN04_11025 [Thermoprotei archaeon]|nr:MAG: hypothetical protein DRN04_11025 [Thermoprotei archaeon]